MKLTISSNATNKTLFIETLSLYTFLSNKVFLAVLSFFSLQEYSFQSVHTGFGYKPSCYVLFLSISSIMLRRNNHVQIILPLPFIKSTEKFFIRFNFYISKHIANRCFYYGSFSNFNKSYLNMKFINKPKFMIMPAYFTGSLLS